MRLRDMLRRLIIGERRHAPRDAVALDATDRIERIEHLAALRSGHPIDRIREEAMLANQRMGR